VALYKVKIPSSSGSSAGDVRVNIPSRSLGSALNVPRTVWAIGGGKGGIGKTLITSNMAVYLSWLNKRVIVVDMDLGGANLHTSLGVDAPVRTLSDLVLGRVENVEDLLQSTPVRNLHLISGAQDPVGIANMRHMQKARLIRKFREIDADFVLLDLGAGTAVNTLDFFLLADKKIVIVTPEPTSIENAYRFIKSAFYRMLRASTPSPHVRQLVEQAMDMKNTRGIRTPKDLLSEVSRLSPEEGNELQAKMREFRIALIVNQVRVKSEADIGKSIQMVCERYFGMSVDYMGYLPYDNSVWQSIRRRVPFLIDAPNSTAVTHLENILRNLLRSTNSGPSLNAARLGGNGGQEGMEG
jgi:flagellar biosynthesis protein FlhG